MSDLLGVTLQIPSIESLILKGNSCLEGGSKKGRAGQSRAYKSGHADYDTLELCSWVLEARDICSHIQGAENLSQSL